MTGLREFTFLQYDSEPGYSNLSMPEELSTSPS